MSTKNIDRWLNWMLTTSIPLRRLDAADVPMAFASGCLIDFRGRRFLLSVEHAVKMSSAGWVIGMGYKPRVGTEIFPLRPFNYVGEITKGIPEIRKIDFAYTEVPKDLMPMYKHATPRGISDERLRHVFDTTLSDLPTQDEIYAFAGEVKTEMHAPDIFVSEMAVCPGLRYQGTDGPFHIFKLPVAHPGHDNFFGCSGAPVVDTKRRVVGLVCEGDVESSTIRAVSLPRYKFALDFVCGGHHLALTDQKK